MEDVVYLECLAGEQPKRTDVDATVETGGHDTLEKAGGRGRVTLPRL